MEGRGEDGGLILCSHKTLTLPRCEQLTWRRWLLEEGGWKGWSKCTHPWWRGYEKTAARESSIFLPPTSSLRLSHPLSTPVILQRGRIPYGCKELLSEMFSLSWVAGWEGWPRIHLCQYIPLWYAEQEVGPFAHTVFMGLCSQILHAPAEFLVCVSTNKNSPYFHFLFLE